MTNDNYTQLVELYNKYRSQGLVVLGFPCGQFMGQELNTEGEIKNFVTDNFKVEFPMFEKVEVNGDNMHLIYKYLKFNTPELNTPNGLKNIPWNFSKFLLDRNANVIKYYGPKTKPNEMMSDIQKLL